MHGSVRSREYHVHSFILTTTRCVTFEEPTPSSRGGLWPRSVKDPVRSSPLKQTLVEACSAVSDHVSQVRDQADLKYLETDPKDSRTPQHELTNIACFSLEPTGGVGRHCYESWWITTLMVGVAVSSGGNS